MESSDGRLEPFIEATVTALGEMAGVEVFARDVASMTDVPCGDVAVALRLLAAKPGWLVLGAPSESALAITRRVLSGIDGDPDAEATRDCMAEVLNVLAGQAKALVFGSDRHFDLATPTAVTPGLFAETAEWHVVPFDSAVGPFTLYVRPPLSADPGR